MLKQENFNNKCFEFLQELLMVSGKLYQTLIRENFSSYMYTVFPNTLHLVKKKNGCA